MLQRGEDTRFSDQVTGVRAIDLRLEGLECDGLIVFSIKGLEDDARGPLPDLPKEDVARVLWHMLGMFHAGSQSSQRWLRYKSNIRCFGGLRSAKRLGLLVWLVSGSCRRGMLAVIPRHRLDSYTPKKR